MATDDNVAGVQEFDHEEVMNPTFRLERGDEDQPSVDLRMQLFRQISPLAWVSLPEDQWHLLASVSPGWITMHPIYTNPHTQRYGNARHGKISSKRVVPTPVSRLHHPQMKGDSLAISKVSTRRLRTC
ncbi:hypothetical protein [Pseudomonas frederiksbergensis]|nr:hypothetical protein [Pseudomonas frederiksbergensis]